MMFLRILCWRLIKLLIKWQFPTVQQLSTAELATWLQQDKLQPLLLDARTPQEYQVSHLPNAKLVPNNIEDLEELTATNPSTPVVVYCSVGYRSAAITRRLQSMGYKSVFNLRGSIFQWVNENRPVYQAGRLVNQVHPYNRFWQYLLVDSNKAKN